MSLLPSFLTSFAFRDRFHGSLPGLSRQFEFLPAKLTEPIDQLSGILANKIPGLIRQLREVALQSSPGK